MADINVTLSDDIVNVAIWWDDINVIFKDWATWPPWPVWAGFNYTYNQWVSLSIWTIVHNLEWYPAWIIVVDSWGTNIVNFNITYVDENTITLEFSWAMTWTTYLS